MSETQYEFTPEQNTLLSDLAEKMKYVAIFEMTLAVVYSATAIFGHWEGLGSAILQAVLGYFTFVTSQFFRKVVDSEGNDMTHLNNALMNLRTLYGIQFWFTVITILFLLISLGFLIFHLMQVS